jgi:hypothetical protein
MSEDRGYEKLMLHHGMPGCLVVQLLPLEGKWTFVVLLCVASQAAGDDRGTLIVSDAKPVDPEWIAKYAGVDVETVKATLATLADHGTLVNEDRHGALRFANWDHYNPKRKPSDSRKANRERKAAQREREKAAAEAQQALVIQDEVEGRAPQTVMDEQRSAPIRAVADDGTNRACPVVTCNAQEGEQCRDRNGKAKPKPHAKRLRAPDQDAFFRVTRDRASVVAERPEPDRETWAPIADVLRTQVPEFAAHTYLDPLELVGRERGVLYLIHPDGLETWVRDRYSSLIAKTASDVLGEPVAVELVDEQWRPAERAA